MKARSRRRMRRLAGAGGRKTFMPRRAARRAIAHRPITRPIGTHACATYHSNPPTRTMDKPTRKRKCSYAQIGTAATSFVAGISVSRMGALNPYMSNLSIQLTAATTKKQPSEIDRQCRALWNQTIVPWTPQSSFRSISNRYLPCVRGSWFAQVADRNYKQ